MKFLRCADLFEPQQAFDKIRIGSANDTFLAEGALAFFGFFGQDVTFEGLLEGDLTGAGHFKPLLGTRVGLNLWHFKCFLYDTLLADPHRRNT